MANYENVPNSGALYKNKYKEQGDKKPDWSGPWVNERGDDMRIGIWFRTSKAGQPYMYVQVDEKTQSEKQQPIQQFESAPTPPMPVEMEQGFNEEAFLGDNGWSPK